MNDDQLIQEVRNLQEIARRQQENCDDLWREIMRKLDRHREMTLELGHMQQKISQALLPHF